MKKTALLIIAGFIVFNTFAFSLAFEGPNHSIMQFVAEDEIYPPAIAPRNGYI
ncbi:MAG: hypothetical protein K0S04_520 [Herbinix sp.]|jgi:hypothetical protein|nr:hypothetical protein [Herbinix sp.]